MCPVARCRRGLRRDPSGSALPKFPQSVSRGARLSRLHWFAFATACQVARPPGRIGPSFPGPPGTFTSRLPAGRSPFPPLDMTITATGLLCWRDFHPQEWQLASLHRINPGPLLYAPEDVAEAIVGLARSPRDEVAVGWPARAAQAAYARARGPTERLIGAAVRYAYRQAGPTPRTDGALRHPVPQGTEVRGGWRGHNRVPSARPASLAAGAVLLLGATAALAYARTGSRRRG